MADGSDAIADWPLLNALVNTASGASWVSIHHGGGVGIGRSIHAGQVCVADGTALAGAEDRAGAHQRPGDGRHPARRRRLRRGRARSPTRTGVRVPMREGRRDRRDARPVPPGSGRCGTRSRRRPGRRQRRLPALRAGPSRSWRCRELVPRAGRPTAACRSTEDGNGNLFAWWGDPDGRRRGAHRQPLRLGAARRGVRRAARHRHRVPRRRRAARPRASRPAGRSASAAFAEEEGSRFGVACLGSRLLTGAIDAGPRGRRCATAAGVSFAEALGDRPAGAPTRTLLGRFGCLRRAARRAGPRAGRPRRAGRRGQRDLAARPLAASTSPARATTPAPPGWPTAATRCSPSRSPCWRRTRRPGCAARTPPSAGSRSSPNATNAIPSRVTAWLDARAAEPDDAGRRWSRRYAAKAAERAGRDGTALTVTAESVTPAGRLRRRAAPTGWPRCWRRAGAARPAPGTTPGCWPRTCPTAMLFVRNPTGVSHSPAEHADRRRLRGRGGRAGRRAGGAGMPLTTCWLAEHAWLPERPSPTPRRADRGRRTAGSPRSRRSPRRSPPPGRGSPTRYGCPG